MAGEPTKERATAGRRLAVLRHSARVAGEPTKERAFLRQVARVAGEPTKQRAASGRRLAVLRHSARVAGEPTTAGRPRRRFVLLMCESPHHDAIVSA